MNALRCQHCGGALVAHPQWAPGVCGACGQAAPQGAGHGQAHGQPHAYGQAAPQAAGHAQDHGQPHAYGHPGGYDGGPAAPQGAQGGWYGMSKGAQIGLTLLILFGTTGVGFGWVALQSAGVVGISVASFAKDPSVVPDRIASEFGYDVELKDIVIQDVGAHIDVLEGDDYYRYNFSVVGFAEGDRISTSRDCSVTLDEIDFNAGQEALESATEEWGETPVQIHFSGLSCDRGGFRWRVYRRGGGMLTYAPDGTPSDSGF